MTVYTSWEDEPEININFSKEKYKKIREKLGVKSKSGKDNRKELQLIFLAAIKEFRRGWLSPDDLAEIGHHVFFKLNDNSDLANQACAAAELAFNTRAIGRNEESDYWLVRHLKDIYDYYQTYKLKIEHYE